MKTKSIRGHVHKATKRLGNGRGVHGVSAKVDVHASPASKLRKHGGSHGGHGAYKKTERGLVHRSGHASESKSLSWLKQVSGSAEIKGKLISFLQAVPQLSTEEMMDQWRMLLGNKEVMVFLHGLEKSILSQLLDCMDMRMALELVEQDGTFDEFVLGEKVHSDEGWLGWFWSLVRHFSPFRSLAPGGYVLKRMEAIAHSNDVLKFEQAMSDVMGHVTRFHMKGVANALKKESDGMDDAVKENGDLGRFASSVSNVLSERGEGLENTSERNRNVVVAMAEIINKRKEGLGDLWQKAYLDVYKLGAPLGLEDWWLAAKLAGECHEQEIEVRKLMDAIEGAPLSRESKILISKILSECSDASFALRGAHYVFDHDEGRSYEYMRGTFREEAFLRGGWFTQEMMKGHGVAKSLRTRFLGSSHYANQKSDPRLAAQMGIDIPGVGHLLFGQRIKKDEVTGEERVESWFQFEAHGARNVFDYALHGMDYIRHRRSYNAQVGPLGYCRHTEKNGTELMANALVKPQA